MVSSGTGLDRLARRAISRRIGWPRKSRLDFLLLPRDCDTRWPIAPGDLTVREARRPMERMGFLALAVTASVVGAPLRAQGASTETIVLVRHGEKPQAGLGQLSCRGLNRALALPAVIRSKFGRPTAIFAPDPAGMKVDRDKDEAVGAGGGVAYSYVRPLATIEPTAIAFGLPVNTQIRFDDVAGLQGALLRSEYRDALVLVAWEHREIVEVARGMARAFGFDAGRIPEWGGGDFDGVYVVKVTRDGAGVTMGFEVEREGLDGRSGVCPLGG